MTQPSLRPKDSHDGLGSLQPAHILFVEDSDSDIAYVKQTLRTSSPSFTYDIETAPTLLEAIRHVNDNGYDLIMVDLNLLDINGLVVISALRAEAGETPIIVYSGVNDRRWKEWALKYGVANYLVKGYDEGMTLAHTVEKVLAKRTLN